MKTPLFRSALPLCLLAFSIFAGCAGTPAPEVPPAPQAPPVSAPETPAAVPPDAVAESDLLPVDPAVTMGRLDNGLTYYIRENTRPENRAELWLVVNTGSIEEDEDQRGLAHFVEHMAFNGTENFAKQELVEYLESIGMQFGPDINAFTSFDETVYMLKVPTDDEATLDTAFQILEDWAHAVTFDPEEIEKERGVVIEEWRLRRGAGARIMDKQFPVLFKDSRYAERMTIGEVETLQSAPPEAFVRFYEDWYRPELMAVVAVGDFDGSAIRARIEHQFGGLENPEAPRERRLYEVPDHARTLYSIESDPEQAFSTVGVYQKLPVRSQRTRDDYRRKLAEQLYHMMFNARLVELTQQADPPFLGAVSTTGNYVRTLDVYYQSAVVEEGGVELGLEALLTEVERVDRHGFTSGELERAKADLLRAFERAYEERDKRDSSTHASEYMRNFLEDESIPGIEFELELVEELLPSLGLEELNRLADDWITDGNRVVLIAGPERPEGVIAEEATLAEIFESIDGKEIEPWIDRVRDRPLLARPPEPSAIVARRQIPEIGVTEWTLANGVEVVLKPTDFKNDQILLTGFSPGGDSLVEDARFVSANFATAAASEGGLGDFSAVELEKALAGKAANASAFIGELEEGIRASASPRDLETMLQLVYLRFTAARRDEEAFGAYMARVRSFLENRLARPETVFSDELTVTLSQGHFRRRPPSPEMADEVDLDTALEIYRDRFADAGDFRFILVGNFEPDAIAPLVEAYLGGLPAGGREESWRDIGLSFPETGAEVVVRQGIEPKSQVRIIFGGPAEWSRENLHAAISLGDAFRIRLREVLREDMGGTYGVSVTGSLSLRPTPSYRFTIGFGCAPENVESMIDTVFEEIRALKRDGLDEIYVEKVREIQLRERETNLKENSFWLSGLKNYYDLGWDPRLLLDFGTLVAAVTTESLRETANRLLDESRVVRGVLYPAEEPEPEARSSGAGSDRAGQSIAGRSPGAPSSSFGSILAPRQRSPK